MVYCPGMVNLMMGLGDVAVVPDWYITPVFGLTVQAKAVGLLVDVCVNDTLPPAAKVVGIPVKLATGATTTRLQAFLPSSVVTFVLAESNQGFSCIAAVEPHWSQL